MHERKPDFLPYDCVFSLQAVLDEEYDDIVGFNVWHGSNNANNGQYDTWKNVTIYVSARHDWETGIVCASGVTLPPTTSYSVNAIPRFVQCASMLAGTKVVTITRFFPTGGSLAITELQAMRIGGESIFLPSSAMAASVRVLSACACTCTHVGTLPTTQNDYAWVLAMVQSLLPRHILSTPAGNMARLGAPVPPCVRAHCVPPACLPADPSLYELCKAPCRTVATPTTATWFPAKLEGDLTKLVDGSLSSKGNAPIGGAGTGTTATSLNPYITLTLSGTFDDIIGQSSHLLGLPTCAAWLTCHTCMPSPREASTLHCVACIDVGVRK